MEKSFKKIAIGLATAVITVSSLCAVVADAVFYPYQMVNSNYSATFRWGAARDEVVISDMYGRLCSAYV